MICSSYLALFSFEWGCGCTARFRDNPQLPKFSTTVLVHPCFVSLFLGLAWWPGLPSVGIISPTISSASVSLRVVPPCLVGRGIRGLRVGSSRCRIHDAEDPTQNTDVREGEHGGVAKTCHTSTTRPS